MAYAVVKKRRKLLNPGRRRRMTAKQIRYFGTKRQRAALRHHHKMKSRRHNAPRPWKAIYRKRYPSKRRHNISGIMVATIPGFNPGRKRRKRRSNRGMARVSAKRRRAGLKAARTRRARRYARSHGRRRHNRRHYRVRNRTKVVYRYRGHHRRHNRGHRRRNPFGFGGGGDVQAVTGIIAGAAVTRLLTGFVPAQYNAGIPGYIITAIAAVLQGQVVGKVAKSPQFGKYMTWGGLTYLGLRIINDMIPTLSGYLPFGLQGLGLISPSPGFFNPQVFGPGGSVVLPNSIQAALATSASKGMRGMTDGFGLNSASRRGGRVQ